MVQPHRGTLFSLKEEILALTTRMSLEFLIASEISLLFLLAFDPSALSLPSWHLGEGQAPGSQPTPCPGLRSALDET